MAFIWNDQTSNTVTMAPDNGYVIDNGATLVTATLPVSAAFGTIIAIVGYSAGGWTIAQNAGQSINFGSNTTTIGATGTLSSTNSGDCVELVCSVADTVWIARDAFGNLAGV